MPDDTISVTRTPDGMSVHYDAVVFHDPAEEELSRAMSSEWDFGGAPDDVEHITAVLAVRAVEHLTRDRDLLRRLLSLASRHDEQPLAEKGGLLLNLKARTGDLIVSTVGVALPDEDPHFETVLFHPATPEDPSGVAIGELYDEGLRREYRSEDTARVGHLSTVLRVHAARGGVASDLASEPEAR